MTVRYDYARLARVGMPEATFCLGKTTSQLRTIVAELAERPDNPVLFTRMTESQYQAVRELAGQSLAYDVESATAVMHGCLPAREGKVAVVTAGTSDIPVAAEACRTLEFLGFAATRIVDVGVAGLWRLLERIDEIAVYDVVIVVAGMDAALASVVGGLTGQPLIAVPTSTGYGAAANGETALRAMLSSCAQGIPVMNIDNGFGAACAANRILLTLNRK
ncbi:phosphoribosylaminoimidazole carboxylase, catalytic subunit [Mycobacterium basiliense]|uniref:Phosphoribosylaminoimidazole carboxylase, catalytic subunit n=1 Tax=Mycobacterium basiliense TaxID=2094119 RepID=A0A447GD46_9MYCO|nr:nickel pincer cofactor biosynthesis protein LarB [Mycobacterium basiliense]VDM88402.1 phosphoribosylaminoimidazole carboxylase, catalytic subunit [Mycobacterium basiliense]